MQGNLIKVGFNFEVMYYDADNVRKYLHLLPETNTENLQEGMEVHFEEVTKLKMGPTYTSAEGWNLDPVEGIYARLMWSPTLYSEIEIATIRWSNDGTRTAGDLTREILALIEKYKS